MTRVVAFLAAALVVVSLGVAAQDSATSRQNSSVQQTSVNGGAQPPTTQAGSPGTSASVPSSPANDSGQAPATDTHTAGVKDSAQDGENAAKNNAELPQTSTILPLLGLIGLGSLVAGFFARR